MLLCTQNVCTKVSQFVTTADWISNMGLLFGVLGKDFWMVKLLDSWSLKFHLENCKRWTLYTITTANWLLNFEIAVWSSGKGLSVNCWDNFKFKNWICRYVKVFTASYPKTNLEIQVEGYNQWTLCSLSISGFNWAICLSALHKLQVKKYVHYSCNT